MLGSALFVGWCATLLWVPRLGDKFGRKWLFTLGMGGNFLCYNILMFTHNLNLMLFTIFCFGALSSIRINVGYVYLLELMPKNRQTLYGTIWNNFECILYPLATIYFWKISKDWFYFALIGYVFSLWSFIASFFLPESPRYLIS